MAHTTLPHTLLEWRDRAYNPAGSEPYDLWATDHLRQFLRRHGYEIWIKLFPPHLGPPNGKPRAPDGFSYRPLCHFVEGMPKPEEVFPQVRNIHCPARNTYNQDVLIRLISIEGDPAGDDHYEALRRLSIGLVAARGDNHTVPVLSEIDCGGLKFAVFPLMFPCDQLLWFYSLSEILDFLEQVFQAVKFAHDNLVAHLDLAMDNFLVNFAGDTQCTGGFDFFKCTPPLRSQFPVRYYLNDFEYAVCFPKDSLPSSRTISGYPNVAKGKTKEQYARTYAPEMLKEDGPYCPFKADVWYLGTMLESYLGGELRAFLAKHLTALGATFNFEGDSVSLLTEPTENADQRMNLFSAYVSKLPQKGHVSLPRPTEALRLVFAILLLIEQAKLESPGARPTAANALERIVSLKQSSSQVALSAFVGAEDRWEEHAEQHCAET